VWDWGGGPSSIPPWEGAVPSPKFDVEKTYFCRLFSTKIYLYNQKDAQMTAHMGCNALWLTVDV